MEDRTARSSKGLEQPLAWLAFGLAAYYLIIFVLGVSGLAQSLLESGNSSGEFLYNLGMGVVPTLLWLTLVGGLWFLSRDTPGERLTSVVFGAIVLDQVLENLWPRLQQGAVSDALMWFATLLSLSVVLLLGLALQRSRIVSDVAIRLALFWGIARSIAGLLRVLSNRVLSGETDALLLSTVLDIVSRYALPFVRIGFLVAVGASLIGMSASAGSARLTSASSRLR